MGNILRRVREGKNGDRKNLGTTATSLSAEVRRVNFLCVEMFYSVRAALFRPTIEHEVVSVWYGEE